MHQVYELELADFIKANPSNGKCNYKSIELILNILTKSVKGNTNMSRIEAVNQLLYILPTMEKSKKLWMMCKVRKVTTKEEKNKKDPHHMALLLDR